MDNRPNKIKTIFHPHKTNGLARKCNQNDLFIVSGGLQCGNCLELVVVHKIIHPEDEDYEKE